MFCTRRNYLPTVLRLVVCPLVVLVLLWVCHASSWVADGKNILMTVYLAAINPACATVTSMAQLYDRDAAHSSALYVLTTLLSHCVYAGNDRPVRSAAVMSCAYSLCQNTIERNQPQ